MKMFKKLMAVALVGVMALSMLTGCAAKNERDMENALEIAGQSRNPSVTIKVDNSKKVAGKSLSKWAEEMADKLDDEIDPQVGYRADLSTKVFVYVVKEQSTNEKWRNQAGKAVDALVLGAAQDADNGKYYVATEGFKAKKEAGKKDKAEYVVIVAQAK